jgi:hypothetical protein
MGRGLSTIDEMNIPLASNRLHLLSYKVEKFSCFRLEG